MADLDPPEIPPPDIPLPPPAEPGARCPWCSAPVTSPDAVTCSVCSATLEGDAALEIPGVTEIDGFHASRAVAPRKVRRSFGSLFVGGDDPIPPPSQAELPALAMPDSEVRREMLRIRMDAELADLTARVAALAAERGIVMPDVAGSGAGEDAVEPRASATDAGPDAVSTEDTAPPEEHSEP